MAAAKFVLTRKIFARHRRSHFIGGSPTAATKERRSSQQILKLQSRLTRHCRLVSKMVSYLLFSFFWLKIVGIHIQQSNKIVEFVVVSLSITFMGNGHLFDC
jgi:hypothetical protein